MASPKSWNRSSIVALLVHFGILEEPESAQNDVAYQTMIARLEKRNFEVGLSVGLVSILILEVIHFLFAIGLSKLF